MKISRSNVCTLVSTLLIFMPMLGNAGNRELRKELSGRYDGRGRLAIEGESVSGDAFIIMPRRVGKIEGRIDPDGIDQKLTGTVNRIRCRRNVIVYFGKLRIEEGPVSVTGPFRAKARRRKGNNTLSLPISISRDFFFDTIRVTGRFKGAQLPTP